MGKVIELRTDEEDVVKQFEKGKLYKLVGKYASLMHTVLEFVELDEKVGNDKMWAIMSGGDWYDAGVDHVILPIDGDIEQLHREYQVWYKNDYLGRKNQEYKTFAEWLTNRNGRIPSDDELEEWWVSS